MFCGLWIDDTRYSTWDISSDISGTGVVAGVSGGLCVMQLEPYNMLLLSPGEECDAPDLTFEIWIRCSTTSAGVVLFSKLHTRNTHACTCLCVRACVRACMRACVRACAGVCLLMSGPCAIGF